MDNSGKREIRMLDFQRAAVERGVCIGGGDAGVGKYVRQARKEGRMGRTESCFPKDDHILGQGGQLRGAQ